MAEITDMYEYPDAEKLEPSEHNKNVFSHNDGRSIMGTANGNIDKENFDTSAPPGVVFSGDPHSIGAQHIQPEETHTTSRSHGMEPLDFWAKAFGQTVSGSDTEVAALFDREKYYSTLPGCSVRIYVPYDCRALMFQWSFQYSLARTWAIEERITNEQGDIDTERVDGEHIYHLAFYNGEPRNRTYRRFPRTMHPRGYASTSSVDSVAMSNHETFTSTEGRNARQWDFHFLETNVKKGWHEISARIFMDPTARILDKDIFLTTAREGRKSTSKAHYTPCYLNNRVTFGIRNARAVAFSAGHTQIIDLVTST